jgi:P63C domain
MFELTPQSKGGAARAKSLSKEDRSAIARRAALARHSKGLPKAIAEGTLIIGDLRISCAVLDDEIQTRVLTQEGFLTAIGRAGKAKGGEGAGVDGKPAFLRAQNLEPFISNDLIASTTPVEFVPLRGPGYQGRAFGYRARLLPDVCWVYQDAMVAGKLLPSQTHIGKACRDFLKALTNHAIDDLVDLATGYEDMRKRRAINQIIDKYVEKSARPWVKMFDLKFYRHIYRLNGWDFDPENSARPGVIGTWTNDIYDRLAPGVKGELHSRVKRNAKGKPTQKLTQLLTPEEGKPALEKLLEGVILLMRMSTDWAEFRLKLEEYYPKFGDTLQLPFDSGVYYLPAPKT